MSVINTNIAASVTANAMRANQRTMENTMERLSTGQRINSASDDAAGLAIGTKMESQIRGLNQAVRNANDAISLLQTADAASIEIGDMLQRMRELAVQSRNATNSTTDITNLNKEFAALATEIDRVANDTTFNGKTLLDSGQTFKFGIGADETDIMTVTLTDFNLAAGGTSVNETLGTSGALASGNGLVASQADMRTAIAAGSITMGDGTTTISISLADVQATANDGSIAASAVTQAEFAAALTAKANESSAFTATFTADGTAGLDITEKAGFGGVDDTYTIGGHSGLTTTKTLSTGVTGTGTGVMANNISAYATASSVTVDDDGVIANLDSAILGVATARADFGASINTLEYSVDNLNNAVQNTMAAKSAIMDADYASETTELARTQIISQASTAMLSQANQQAQSVLALLKQ